MDTQRRSPDTIPFVDCHHHLWDLNAFRYPWLEGEGDAAYTAWLGDYRAIRRSYLIEDYLRDAEGSGLTKSVHIESGWTGPDLAGETRWLQGLAERFGFPNGIVAGIDLRAADAEQQLDHHAESPNFRGVRMRQMEGLVEDPEFLRGFHSLSARGLTYDLNTRVPHTGECMELARRFPDTVILICNTGNPMERGDGYFQEWRKEMAELAAFPNVVVKISGLGMSDHKWTVESIRRWVLTAIDLFGPSRSMFASNWPADGLYGSYRHTIDAYHMLTVNYSLSERIAMFSGNAERFYRI